VKQRVHIAIRGAVQGVGFRPYVYRLASSLGLTGWVLNSPQGVFIDAEGEPGTLEAFLTRLPQERPPRSFIQSLESSTLDPLGYTTFEIRESETSGNRTALVLPDIATCPDCLRELFDPGDRRYLYPFTNCTNCGPRFSIMTTLPYDRPNTSMAGFTMCPLCRKEYADPNDRRFHAQPNACPACGPRVELWDADGRRMASGHEAITAAAAMVSDGAILAAKAVGGFHLVVNAERDDAVRWLRQRKHREEKPFALLAPSIEWVRSTCSVSSAEERLLQSAEAPIVLLARSENRVAPSVAPDNPYLGVMLPSNPLQHILVRELGIPLVATSGNLTDEPICTDEKEAVVRLKGIADAFLVHNRPIVRHVDDSIARMMAGRELILRRARGYAPLPVTIPKTSSDVLAVGAHLKNTVAVAKGTNVFISQHIGDLETGEAYDAFQRAVNGVTVLFDARPVMVVSDLHPDYLSTKYARGMGLPVVAVQHHFAHVTACMAENQLDDDVLGVSWDGTGYGTDGTIWGGEFLVPDGASFHRAGSFRTFMLPGGDRAIKEPRRTALGLLYELFGTSVGAKQDLAPIRAFTARELGLMVQALEQKVNTPRTSSAGRLFDAVASLLDRRQTVTFEGQAAMELEFAAHGAVTDALYEARITDEGIFDWEATVRGILADIGHAVDTGTIAAKFHNTLTDVILAMARRTGRKAVVLTGGCFQNKYLTERTVRRLREEGFRPYWHQRVPPNDGGIALGQIVAAIRR
jgi:hydrogenase maturation protein HypF